MKDTQKSAKQKETLFKVLNYIKPYRFLMILTIIMAAASVALTLYLPILTGNAVDSIAELFEGGISIPKAFSNADFWAKLTFILKKMGKMSKKIDKLFEGLR